MLLLALDGVFEFLHWMVNAFLCGRHCSNMFKVTQIKHVLKPGKPKTQIDSFRQISLNGIVRKLTEKMIMRIILHVTETGLVHESSMAGLKGKSALDAVTILTTDVLRG